MKIFKKITTHSGEMTSFHPKLKIEHLTSTHVNELNFFPSSPLEWSQDLEIYFMFT